MTEKLREAAETARHALDEFLDFQSAKAPPSIHDWGRWQRAAATLRDALAQPAEPLTEEEIQAEYKKVWDIIGSMERASRFARAIEAAHGIK